MHLSQPHRTVFLEVAQQLPESDITDYVRDYFGCRTDGALLVAAALRGLDAIRLSPPLPLVERKSTLARFTPDTVKKLAGLELALVSDLQRKWHMPPGENIVSTSVEVLSEQFQDCEAGTVAVVRRSNKATLAFLFPHLRLDLATGAVSGTQAPPAVPFAAPMHMPLATQAAPGGGMDAAHMALETASTLAFALPEPWGIIGSAALNLIDMLLPKEKSTLAKDVADALGAYMTQHDLNNWVGNAHALMVWSNEQLENMRSVDPANSEVQDTLLPDLERNLAPGNESLYNSLLRIASSDYIKEKGAFDILLVCVSSYLFGLKFKLLLEAHVASNFYKQGNMDQFNEWNQRWRYDYVNFKNAAIGSGDGALQGWAVKVAQIIQDRISSRLGQVSPVRRGDQVGIGMCTGSGMCQTTHKYYWEFVDQGDPSASHRFYDTHEHCDDIEHKADAEKARAEHVAALSNQLDDIYGPARLTVKKWADSINQWNEHLPPGKPAGKPTIDPNGWQAGGGGVWQQHATVAYAVAFYNDRGEGLLGDWSATADIGGRSCPTLANVPLDDLKMATGRRIYRRFDTGPATLHALIANNTATSYVDKT